MNIKKLMASIIIVILFITGCSFIQDNSLDQNKELENSTGETGNKVEDEDYIEKDEPIDQIKIKVKKMTIEEKVGQLVLVGMEGYEVNDNIKELIETYHIGGVILYGKNIRDSNQLISLINSLKNSNSSNKTPLFISVDEEGGSVSRNPNEVKRLPTARSIGETKDRILAFEGGKLLGKTVKGFGYNMNFAPVMDIDSNPLNPVIGNRAFGETVELVSSMGIETLKGIKEEGVIPVIKHFPGHGDTIVDSHIGLPIVEHDLARLNGFELIPFKNAIDNGAEVVMIAHILLPKIDNIYPASMSSTMITNILREELGFQGVVITDDITMGAIDKNYKLGDAAIQSLVAGADIILVGHNYEKAVNVLNEIKTGIDGGIISIDRIDESVYKILKLKEEYKLQDNIISEIDFDEINRSIDGFLNKITNY